VLIAGDYLSAVELPTLSGVGSVDAYLATLEHMRSLVAATEHVVPGHGPVLDSLRALAVLEEDVRYLRALAGNGTHAELPAARRGAVQRQLHRQNVAGLK
jgi:glyoxylase-like metal-dependent hydrolase (beta-lactamase superfamily II)